MSIIPGAARISAVLCSGVNWELPATLPLQEKLEGSISGLEFINLHGARVQIQPKINEIEPNSNILMKFNPN